MHNPPSRRVFLKNGLKVGVALMLPLPRPAASQVMTVRGPVAATALGLTLVHEHVLVDFIGADKITPDRYQQQEAFRFILNHLQALYNKG
jgi:phosphotriesterase-related protein